MGESWIFLLQSLYFKKVMLRHTADEGVAEDYRTITVLVMEP